MNALGWLTLDGCEVFNDLRTYHRLACRLENLSITKNDPPCEVLATDVCSPYNVDLNDDGAAVLTYDNPFPYDINIPYDGGWMQLDFDDDPPWYDTNAPESEEFIGFWVESFEFPSVVSRSAFPRSGPLGGSTIGKVNRSQREMPIEVTLIAETDAGMRWGLDWLAAKLTGCSDCGDMDGLIRLSCTDMLHPVEGLWQLRRLALLDPLEDEGSPFKWNKCLMRQVSLTLVAGDPCRYKCPEDLIVKDSFDVEPAFNNDCENALSSVLAARNTEAVVALAIGDSITEWHSATDWRLRWSMLLQDGWRAAFPTSGIGDGGGIGYRPIWSPYTVGSYLPTTTGTIGAWAVGGLGVRAAYVGSNYLGAGTVGTATWTDIEADQIEIWFVAQGAVDDMEVTIDGGTPFRICALATGGDLKDTRVLIDLAGDSGPHTLTISRHAGGQALGPLVAGIRLYDGDGPTTRYMNLPGVNGYASCPDSAALSITGDVAMPVRVNMADWTPGSVMHFGGKWNSFGTNQRSWRFAIDATGHLLIAWSPDGTSSITATSTVAPFTDGGTYWILPMLDVDNAGQWQVKFYRSSDTTNEWDAVTWTLIDTVNGATGPTSIFNSTASASFGAVFSGSPGYLTGRIYAGAILSAPSMSGGGVLSGTVVASPRFDAGTQRVLDGTGNVWTRAGDATLVCTGTRGIQVIDASRAGATSETFANLCAAPSAYVSDLEDWTTLTGADVAVIALGVNDWQASVPPATYKTNMQKIITALHSQTPNLSILLVPWYEPISAYGGTVTYSDYVDVMHELAAENDFTWVENFWIDPAGDDNATWRPADVPEGRINTGAGFGLHPSDEGHETIAAKMLTAFTPSVLSSVEFVCPTDTSNYRICAEVDAPGVVSSKDINILIEAGSEGMAALTVRGAVNPLEFDCGDDRLQLCMELTVGGIGPYEKLLVDSVNRRIWWAGPSTGFSWVDGIAYLLLGQDEAPSFLTVTGCDAGLIWISPASYCNLSDETEITITAVERVCL